MYAVRARVQAMCFDSGTQHEGMEKLVADMEVVMTDVAKMTTTLAQVSSIMPAVLKALQDIEQH